MPPIIVLVFDNGMYGTIRMHQEREYPGHVIGTDLKNPDFAALARSLWRGLAFHVTRTEDFAEAFEKRSMRKSPRSSTSASIPKRSRPLRR